VIFRPFYRFETGCAAYVFGCGGQGICCVVDPHEADVDAYIEFADIRRCASRTFRHADHRSGGRALAEQTGAKYALHRNAEVAFPFEPLDDGQVIELGNTIIRVLHTPGHTPESIALVVSDLRRGPEPWFVCTGDTMFVGSVGRPDLPGHERDNAAELHRSLHDKLLSLRRSRSTPCFSGSACGAGLSGKPMSTLAFEKQWNDLLALDRETFVDKVAANIPAKPAEMESILRFNQGRVP
jgi:glyoxylase-like metal-dependent hydrolase (beta-lactamase superfamily II)